MEAVSESTSSAKQESTAAGARPAMAVMSQSASSAEQEGTVSPSRSSVAMNRRFATSATAALSRGSRPSLFSPAIIGASLPQHLERVGPLVPQESRDTPQD